METRAAVLDGTNERYEMRTVSLSELAPDEVLVEISGIGLCHTDVAVQQGHLDFPLPGVLGHEGSGIVKDVGADVATIKIGDPVIATFDSCGVCDLCLSGRPPYCSEFNDRNFGGTRADGSHSIHAEDGSSLGGSFFGQSAFASHGVFRERNVIVVPPELDLAIAGPLGCGIQTGAGVVLNTFKCEASDTLLVTGAGSVGLSAVLAAAAKELKAIFVVDPLESRRKLALELGATHVIDPALGSINEQLRAIRPDGVSHALDTSAVISVIHDAVASLGQRGSIATVGVPKDPNASLTLGLLDITSRGISVRGVVEGDSNPTTFLPQLIEMHLNGKFPFDRLIDVMPLDEINEAIEAQARGEVVKVVLTPSRA